MSFAFNPGKQAWTDGGSVRTHFRFSNLSDFSVVDNPVYEASSVEVAKRSIAQAAYLVDTAESELRSGKTLSKATISALVPAVGSLVAAGQHVGNAHKNVTALLAKHGVSLNDAQTLASDGSGSNPNPDFGDIELGGDGAVGGGVNGGNAWGSGGGLGNGDGTGSRHLTPARRDLLVLYREVLEDEERESDERRQMVAEILAELRAEDRERTDKLIREQANRAKAKPETGDDRKKRMADNLASQQLEEEEHACYSNHRVTPTRSAISRSTPKTHTNSRTCRSCRSNPCPTMLGSLRCAVCFRYPSRIFRKEES